MGQFKQLLHDGYQETMSLECEFKAPGLTHTETTERSYKASSKLCRRLSRKDTHYNVRCSEEQGLDGRFAKATNRAAALTNRPPKSARISNDRNCFPLIGTALHDFHSFVDRQLLQFL